MNYRILTWIDDRVLQSCSLNLIIFLSSSSSSLIWIFYENQYILILSLLWIFSFCFMYLDPCMHSEGCSCNLEHKPLDWEIEHTFHQQKRGNKGKHTLVEPPLTTMAKAERAPMSYYVVDFIRILWYAEWRSKCTSCSIFGDLWHIQVQRVIDDVICLKLFFFSLKDKAKLWLLLQLQDSIRTWDDLSKKFFAKFFPPTKTTKFWQDVIPLA